MSPNNPYIKGGTTEIGVSSKKETQLVLIMSPNNLHMIAYNTTCTNYVT